MTAVRVAAAAVGSLLLGALAGQLLSFTQQASHSDFVWWALSTRNVAWITVWVLVISLSAGSVLGALVAYGPKFFSGVLGRLVELSGALPSLIVVGLWRLGEVEPSMWSFIAVVAALKTIETARLVSNETERISSQAFVIAAHALGARKARVFAVHVFPHLLSTLAVSSALTAAAVVGLEAALSFVGLGLPSSTSWGALLGQAARLETIGAAAIDDPAQISEISTLRIVLALGSICVSTIALNTLSRAIAQRAG